MPRGTYQATARLDAERLAQLHALAAAYADQDGGPVPLDEALARAIADAHRLRLGTDEPPSGVIGPEPRTRNAGPPRALGLMLPRD